MTDPLDTWKSKEEDAIIARSEEASSKLSCFKCGDGSTPLYCLNCANDELHAKCERLEGELAETKQLLAHKNDTANTFMEQVKKLQAQCAEMRACLQELDHSRHLLASGHSAELIAFVRWVNECISDNCGKAILARLEEARWLIDNIFKMKYEPWIQRRDQWLKGQP